MTQDVHYTTQDVHYTTQAVFECEEPSASASQPQQCEWK